MKNRITIPKGAYPEPQEENAAKLLAKYGTVEFIPPIRTKGVHTPDIFWLGKAWEIKTPRGTISRWRFNETLHKAVKQSCNIIIDLRYTKGDDRVYIATIVQLFTHSRSIKHLKIITKSENILDFKKKP